MTAVFVHGVPDTPLIWQPLLKELARKDVVTLALPGFGAALPPGFSPDKDSYADWVIEELKKIGGTIDLVGHDWGSLITTRVISIAPGLCRSWIGGAAPLDPDYVWHDAARVWQTPGAGEEMMKVFTGAPLVAGLAAQGVPQAMAEAAVAHIDDTMKSCILTLYRSAVDVGRAWFGDLKNVRAKTMVLWGEKDPYADIDFGRRLARNVKGKFVEIAGAGHWYQAQKPRETARAITEFWTAL